MSKNLYPNSIRIGLLDPSVAQRWAQRILSDGTTVGSIKKGDTINHTTSQPIATGLFCQRIFGPCIDYTCACGHEKIRLGFNPNISPPVCPDCRVEWTHASVRRQFLGSIELISPVTHKWFSDSRGAYIPTLVGITPRTFRNLKECKVFFPFHFEKNNGLIKERYKKKSSISKTFFLQSTQSKQKVSSNLRAMQTLQLLIDPKKSLDSLLFHNLQLANSLRNFWILSNPFLTKLNKKEVFSKFSDICFFSNAEQFYTSELKPINITRMNQTSRLPLVDNQVLYNKTNKLLVSNLQKQTQEIDGKQEKFTKNSNFYSLIRVIQWLTSEQKNVGTEKRAQTLSQKLLQPRNNFFLREKVSQKNFYSPGYKANFVESTLSPNLYQNSVQFKDHASLPPTLKNSLFKWKATFPLVTEKQPFQLMQISKTQQEISSVKKEVLKYVFVLAKKIANKPSNFFFEKLALFTLLNKQVFLNNALQSKIIFTQDIKNFSFPLGMASKARLELRSPSNGTKTPTEHNSYLNEDVLKIKKNVGSTIGIKQFFPLSENGTYIFRDFTKYQFNSNKTQLVALFGKKKLSSVNFSKQISRKIKDFKTISKYKIGFLSNSTIGLSLTRRPFTLISQKNNCTVPEKIVVKKNFILAPSEANPEKGHKGMASFARPAPNGKKNSCFLRSFNVDHNLPIRPSYTQPEDYRRQFLKFFGKNSLEQKTDIPIFRYKTKNKFSTKTLFQNKQHLSQRPTVSNFSSQAIEVYFSEAKSVAKEQTIKKILSQTGGGGLQTYLGFLNLSELVLILQNDISEIAPRLAKSYATRRVLFSIINAASNSLKETLGLLQHSTTKAIVVSRPLESKGNDDDLIEKSSVLKGKNLLVPEKFLKQERQEGTSNFVTRAALPKETEYLNQLSLNDKIEVLERKCKDVKKEYKAVKKICSDFQNRKNNHKRRYKLAFQLLRTLSNPAGMTMSSVPVLPPGLRPIIDVPKIGPITADLNIRYRSLLFALRNLRELAYVDFRNAGAAQASVQEAVDDLLYTGGKTRRDKSSSNPNLYKSLAMRLKGKHGRFRGNLLGKRVDYSGRSVIVVGPTLKIHQCGLPFEIAIKLFNPFLIRSLIQRGFCKNIYKAKQLLIGVKFKPLIWTLCQEVLSEHLVLLNRAPTLHRLGVQAFVPILVSGRAILLHPLVCTGFNADFDGDQMGVHVPLFPQARAEAWKMMWSRNNFLLPSSGEPVLLPSQDMVLGCYYLTSYAKPLFSNKKGKEQEQSIVSANEALGELCSPSPAKDFNFVPHRTRLSMFLLFQPFFSVKNIQNWRIPLSTTINKSQFETNQKPFWFKNTPLLLSLPTRLKFALDFFALQLNLVDKTDQFQGSSQQQISYLKSDQSHTSPDDFVNIFNSKKSYFNFLFFTTIKVGKQQKKNSNEVHSNQNLGFLLVGHAKSTNTYFLDGFNKKKTEHALTYARVYNLHEKQTILRNKHEQIKALHSFGQPVNIEQKQVDFFNTNKSKLSEKVIRFWSSPLGSTKPSSKIGLSQWSYSPRFAFTCGKALLPKNNSKSFVKNQKKSTLSIKEKELFIKTRGLGTFYSLSTIKASSFFLQNWKPKLHNKHWNDKPYVPFRILSIQTALNFYRKGAYSIQSNIWIYPNKILKKNSDGSGELRSPRKIQIYSQRSVLNNGGNLGQQKVEGDGSPTPTLELRITPFGKMRLLHTGGIKTSTFQKLLLLPTQQPVQTPLFDSFIRTTIGRIIFNNLLEEIANS